MNYEFEWPVRWVVGPTALDQLSAELKRLGSKNPLLLSDEGVAKAGMLDKVLALLRESQLKHEVYDRVPLESDSKVLESLYEFCRHHKIDAVISLGGGSVLDSGKVLALMLGYQKSRVNELESYEYFHEQRFPHVCLPTTSGTGSEAGNGAVVKDGDKKLLVAGAGLYPNVAILDPRLTLSMPTRLRVATAMDAWTHSWESLFGRQRNPLSAALARSCLFAIPPALETLTREPQNAEACLKLSECASLAGIAFTHSMVHMAHSLAHALAQFMPISHGEAVAVFLPLSVSWGLESGDLSLKDFYYEKHTLGWTREEQILEWLFKVRNPLCEPQRLALSLADTGFAKEKIPLLIEAASLDGTSVFIPSRLNSKQIETMVRWAYGRKEWSLSEFSDLRIRE